MELQASRFQITVTLLSYKCRGKVLHCSTCCKTKFTYKIHEENFNDQVKTLELSSTTSLVLPHLLQSLIDHDTAIFEDVKVKSTWSFASLSVYMYAIQCRNCCSDSRALSGSMNLKRIAVTRMVVTCAFRVNR